MAKFTPKTHFPMARLICKWPSDKVKDGTDLEYSHASIYSFTSLQ